MKRDRSAYSISDGCRIADGTGETGAWISSRCVLQVENVIVWKIPKNMFMQEGTRSFRLETLTVNSGIVYFQTLRWNVEWNQSQHNGDRHE